ncbi:MAG: uracil-DNA glycosylase, partial [Candidatus Marinimicrobia bacterium]|nr:uracil-DNA glycosylase [Candidatus Neomarinimicrobiota bacterium]
MELPLDGKLLKNPPSNGNKATSKDLESFYNEIKECQLCPLGATRTKFVFGVGNPNADLMLIGEAPGRNEDLQGEPFVGRAGQLLDKILAAIKLSREEVYIANVLKCRPPNNRDPLKSESDTCQPYLKQQIELIKPKLILALGRVSGAWLLGEDLALKDMRNKSYIYNGIEMMVTYHPAALLRN